MLKRATFKDFLDILASFVRKTLVLPGLWAVLQERASSEPPFSSLLGTLSDRFARKAFPAALNRQFPQKCIKVHKSSGKVTFLTPISQKPEMPKYHFFVTGVRFGFWTDQNVSFLHAVFDRFEVNYGRF